MMLAVGTCAVSGTTKAHCYCFLSWNVSYACHMSKCDKPKTIAAAFTEKPNLLRACLEVLRYCFISSNTGSHTSNPQITIEDTPTATEQNPGLTPFAVLSFSTWSRERIDLTLDLYKSSC